MYHKNTLRTTFTLIRKKKKKNGCDLLLYGSTHNNVPFYYSFVCGENETKPPAGVLQSEERILSINLSSS